MTVQNPGSSAVPQEHLAWHWIKLSH